MLQDLTSKQVSEWMAYYNIEPWGEGQGFYQAGIIASLIANVNRKKGAKPFKPKDFIPDFEQRYRPIIKQSTEVQLEIFKALVKATGGKIIKRKTDG